MPSILTSPAPGTATARHPARPRNAVFSSDLARAAQIASVAFADSGLPVLYDWRPRECDYRRRNGMPVAELRAG
jgi:broad specificity phosphatase PhoE